MLAKGFLQVASLFLGFLEVVPHGLCGLFGFGNLLREFADFPLGIVELILGLPDLAFELAKGVNPALALPEGFDLIVDLCKPLGGTSKAPFEGIVQLCLDFKGDLKHSILAHLLPLSVDLTSRLISSIQKFRFRRLRESQYSTLVYVAMAIRIAVFRKFRPGPI